MKGLLVTKRTKLRLDPFLFLGGDHYDVLLDGAVEFQGSNPIQVAQFAQGGDTDPQNYNNGDPCEILLPPTGRYLSSYTITTGWDDYQIGDFGVNFLNLIVPQSAISTTVVVNTSVPETNSVAESSFVPVGSSGYSAARVPVAPAKTYTVTSSQPFELQVYGFGDYDAYGYLGGLVVFP